MKQISIFALLAIMATCSFGQVNGSFEKLTGTRLEKFRKSRGASERGNHVSLFVPAGIFPIKKKANYGRHRVHHKGVQIEFQVDNPYWVQTKRKIRKSSKGQVLVKGTIRKRRQKDGRYLYYLKTATLQKLSGRAAGGKRKKKI